MLGFLFCLVYNLCFPLSSQPGHWLSLLRKCPLEVVCEVVLVPGTESKKNYHPYIFLHPPPQEYFYHVFSSFLETGSSLLCPQLLFTPPASEYLLQCTETVPVLFTQISRSGWKADRSDAETEVPTPASLLSTYIHHLQTQFRY